MVIEITILFNYCKQPFIIATVWDGLFKKTAIGTITPTVRAAVILRQTQPLNSCTQRPQQNLFKLQQRRFIGKRTISSAQRTHSLRCDTTQQLPAQPNHRIPIRCTGQPHTNTITHELSVVKI